ncbi:MAG: hypothetical protein R6W91_06655 [Thermoplasmata archaeon]
MFLMMGSAVGFLFFYKVFYYFSAPFSADMPMWFMILVLGVMGILGGYLYPDIMNVLAMSIFLPAIGSAVCALISVSPAFSLDLVSSGLADVVFILAKYMIPLILIAFLVFICAGFLAMYAFESDDA